MVPTPSDPLEPYRRIRREAALRRIGDGGRVQCRATSDALDAALTPLAAAAGGSGWALVAVGGYGRRELCLHSDVDVLLLHTGVDPSRLTRPVLYPLWDAGLKVGHAVRTPAECITAAREHTETLTALLDARLVWGDEELVEDLARRLGRYLRGRPLGGRLAALERDRRLTEPFPVMDADVKEGRGGLRTFQGFHWERRRARLVGLPDPYPPTPEEERAYGDLLAVRNALHAAAARPFDEFNPDLRGPAAAWLGVEVRRLAARMCLALRMGDRLASQRWPDAAAPAPRLRWKLGRRSGPAAPADPLERAVAAARRGDAAWLGGEETVAASPVVWDETARRHLLDLLGTGEAGFDAFEWLVDRGWVEENLPEYVPVVAAPQIHPRHRHPVDAHLWRTVAEMVALISGDDPGLAGPLAAAGSTDDLVLAAFLHDLGKGRGGDHSEVGASLAGELCRRLGFPAATAGRMERAVRLHLLLPDAAARSDPTDPEVLDRVAGAAGDVAMLSLLYLLTIADSKATGPRSWTPWKARLVETLYRRVAARLEGSDRHSGLGAIADRVGMSSAAVRGHLADLPPDYPELYGEDEIAVHLRLLGGDPVGDAVVFAPLPGAVDRVVVASRDRVGLLGLVAGVFALHGVSILDARLLTTNSGVALDTFHVTGLREAELDAATWSRIEADVAAAVAGDLDVESSLARKAAAYRRDTEPVDVRAPAAPSGGNLVIEISGRDRPGFLYDVVMELYAAGFDIRAARIGTAGDRVRDTFFVRPVGGGPLPGVDARAEALDSIRAGLRRRGR